MFILRGRPRLARIVTGPLSPRLALPAVLLLAAGPVLTAVPASAASVDQEFLVAVEGDAAGFREEITTAGGTVEQVYGELDMLAVTLPDSAAAILDGRDGVEVEPNPVVRAFATPPSFGLDRIDQRNLPLSNSYTYPSGASGAGVDVYVMDTGVRADHVQFGGRVAAGFTAYADGVGTGDCNGHGTHVAGTVGGSTVGVAPSVRIVPVRVLDCGGSTTTGFEFLDGMDWILAHHQDGQPAVLNMSLGSTASSIIDDAAEAAVDDGISLVVAAGNSNTDACDTSPARAPAALTVAASTVTDSRAAYSNFGSCVDLFAPGGDGSAPVYSAGVSSPSAIAGMAGTSMAAPHVAGAVARYLSTYPSAAPAEVASAILSSATQGAVTSAGAGTPNRLLYAPATGFGPASPDPGREIQDAYERAGGAGGYLRQPTTALTCGLAAGGCYRGFQGGSIHWSPASGAHPTDGAIQAKWRDLGWEGSYLGYPTADPACTWANRGCFQDFQGGTITWIPSGAAAVDGAIHAVWTESGAGLGWLGYPVNSPLCGLRSGACVQTFQAGAVVWTPANGAIAVDGAIWRNWAAAGPEGGALGYPVEEPVCTASGCSQQFEQGEVRWNPSTGAHAFTSAAVTEGYTALGGAAGYLGLPTSDTACVPGGCQQAFQGGLVFARNGEAAGFAVDGAMLTRYQATAGVTGPLGWPTANPVCASGGCTQRFEHGQVLWSSGSGAAALLDGPVADAYQLKGGTAGYLGWPTGDTVCGLTRGGCKQWFQGGAIYGAGVALPLDGAILSRYLQTGAETGPLGYPVSGPIQESADPLRFRQEFNGGYIIRWTAAGGAVVSRESTSPR